MRNANISTTFTRRQFLSLGATVTGAMILGPFRGASAAVFAPPLGSDVPVVSSRASQPEPIRLRWVSVVGPNTPFGEARAKVLDDYRQLNPHVTVEYETIPYDQFSVQLTTRALAGDAPEIAQAGYQTAQFAVNDVLVELTPYIEQDGLDKGDYWPALWQISEFGGKTFGFPFTIDTRFTYYNEQLYQQMGVEVPETWDDVLATAAPALDQGAHAVGMVMTPETLGLWQTGASIIKTNGGDLIRLDSDGTALANLTSPEVVEAVEFMRRLITDRALPESALGDGDAEVRSLFLQKKVASWPIGNWMLRVFDQARDKGDADFTPGISHHPINKQRGSCAGGWAWYVFKTIKDPDVGWDLIRFFNRDENVQQGWADSLPPSRSAMQVPLYSGDPRNTFVEEVLGYSSWPMEPIAGWFEIMPVVWRNVVRALNGELPAAEAMTAGNAEVQALLDRGHNALVGG